MSTQQPQDPQYPAGGQYPPAGQYPAAGQYPPAGQYAQPGSRYGTQPYGADGGYGTVVEPPQHRRLLTLTLVSAALYVLSALPVMFGLPRILDTVLTQGTAEAGLTEAELAEVARFMDLMQSWALGGMIVSVLIGLGLYALVYFGLRGVGGWARVLGIVLAIIGTLSAISGAVTFLVLPGVAGILTSVVSLALAVVNILWLVNAFHADEAAYTRQGRRATA